MKGKAAKDWVPEDMAGMKEDSQESMGHGQFYRQSLGQGTRATLCRATLTVVGSWVCARKAQMVPVVLCVELRSQVPLHKHVFLEITQSSCGG